MKKIIISVIVIIIFLTNSCQIIYAANVSEAFSAAKEFLEQPTTDDTGIVEPILNVFTDIVKAINTVLLVLLFGLSLISISIIGVRYMVSGASPNQKESAKHSLHTLFIGMVYGFGAFVIWNIAMSIVRIIIGY